MTVTARTLLERLAGAELPDWDRFAAGIRRRRLVAGETLFDVERPYPWLVVVGQGLFKLVYVREDGGERIKSFVGEGSFFASLSALAPGGRTTFSAIAMTEGVVDQLDYESLQRHGDRHVEWQRALRVAVQLYGVRKEKRERELLVMSAEERYRSLLAEDPALAARVPLKDLALHLGITPVALSRIRRRMARS
jgi:CRP-like cAMP-binding protein